MVGARKRLNPSGLANLLAREMTLTIATATSDRQKRQQDPNRMASATKLVLYGNVSPVLKK